MDIKATMKEALKELGFSSGDASKITEMETKVSNLQAQIATLTTERDALKTQLTTLTTENQGLQTELEALKVGQQTEAQKTLSAARERAEKAAVAAKAENLDATKATIAALTDLNVLAAMASAWETAAGAAANPDRQTNSSDPATGEEKFDNIRAQVAGRYQTSGYAGKSLKNKEGK